MFGSYNAVQARFGHLTIYGASYYSYLYARCLSEAIWGVHLASDPLDPEAGPCAEICAEQKQCVGSVSTCCLSLTCGSQLV